MKLVYENGKAELLDQDKGKVLKVDVRGNLDLDDIGKLRNTLCLAEMIMEASIGLESCPACGGDEAYILRVHTVFHQAVCLCGMHGPECRTRSEASRAWNRISKELREKRSAVE